MNDNWPVPEIDPTRCEGCGLCVTACPYSVLTLHNGKAIVSQPQSCRYDGCCEQICPQQAITRPYYLTSSPN